MYMYPVVTLQEQWHGCTYSQRRPGNETRREEERSYRGGKLHRQGKGEVIQRAVRFLLLEGSEPVIALRPKSDQKSTREISLIVSWSSCCIPCMTFWFCLLDQLVGQMKKERISDLPPHFDIYHSKKGTYNSSFLG